MIKNHFEIRGPLVDARENQNGIELTLETATGLIDVVWRLGLLEDAQAWRALGFYIDCDYDGAEDYRRSRNLEADDRSGCLRFILWAAVRKSEE